MSQGPIVPGNGKNLNALQSALGAAMDSIGNDGSMDDASTGVAHEDLPGKGDDAEPKIDPPADDDEPDDDDADDSDGDDDEDQDQPPVKKGEKPKAKPNAEVPPPEGGEPKAEDESEKITAALDSMSYPRRKAVEKFLPSGKAATLADLASAQEKADEDYWRLQNRQAAREEDAPPAKKEPEKKEPAPTPRELQVFDQKLQTFQTEITTADDNIKAWGLALQNKRQEIFNLEKRRAGKDPTFDGDELFAAYKERDSIEANIAAWKGRKAGYEGATEDVKHQRGLAQDLVETKARLDRQETEREDRDIKDRTDVYTKEWNTTFDALAKTLKIPEHRVQKFKTFASRETFVEISRLQGAMPVDQIGPFLRKIGKEFVGLYEEAKAEGAQSYSKDKKNDAPPAPTQKKAKAPEGKQSKGKPARRPRSLRELQSRIDKDPAWDEA